MARVVALKKFYSVISQAYEFAVLEHGEPDVWGFSLNDSELLLADEQESMIDRYLERGDMFVLYDNGLKACCVVTREGEGIYEIKNIATISFFQRQGYGKRLIQFLFDHYRGKCSELLVGTGDVPSTLSFYEHCGFTISHRLKNFFTDNYDHPMYEDGKQLVDMVYLKKTF